MCWGVNPGPAFLTAPWTAMVLGNTDPIFDGIYPCTVIQPVGLYLLGVSAQGWGHTRQQGLGTASASAHECVVSYPTGVRGCWNTRQWGR